jgi:broad specificity phosphatase PhoE
MSCGIRRLVLVRHGETTGNSSVRYYGRTDLALSELGREQMRAAGRWLEDAFGRNIMGPVFSSPLRRATEGARLIAGANANIIQTGEFAEIDFGLFEGLTADEIRQQYAAEYQVWQRARFNAAYAYPGGESRSAFSTRVARALDQMLNVLDGAPYQVALLVAHRGVIRTITERLGERSPTVELGSIQLLAASKSGQWQAEMLDMVKHLSPDMRRP